MATRPLMRQKVNIQTEQFTDWKNQLSIHLRNVINDSYMTLDDIGNKFIHKEREFEILGMSQAGTVMLKEIFEGETYYWECARKFVQMKLKRFNKRFAKTPGSPVLLEIPYEETDLLLPPRPRKRRVKKTEDDN